MSYYLLVALAPGSTTESIFEVSVWSQDDLSVSPNVKASLTIDSGYKNMSSIVNWHYYGSLTKRDYKFVRDRISDLRISIGWVNLTQEEKELCCQYFVVSRALRDEIYTTDEQVHYGISYNSNSLKSRSSRADLASSEIRNKITVPQSNEVIDDVSNNSILVKYIEYGRGGTLEGHPEGIYDYLESRVGTSYETTGLRTKPFSPIGTTMLDFTVRLMDILKNGNYILQT